MPFNRTTWVNRYQKGKTSLDLNEAGDDGVLGCSGISWTICKQSAPCSGEITTPTPHHSLLQAGCSFWRPSDSVKTLKAYKSKVKYTDIAVCSLICHTAMGTHVSHSVTCHLTEVTFLPLPPTEAGTWLTDPGGMQGWDDLVGLLHIEMVYPPEDGQPSKY